MSEKSVETTLQFRNMLDERIGAEHGLSRAELDGLAGPMAQFAELIEGRRGEDVGFMQLPYEQAVAARVKDTAEDLRSWCKNFVVLGIGGSALGNITIHCALNHPFHNLLPDGHRARHGAPRIFVLDNVDPSKIAGLLDLIGDQLPDTAFNVITKSGATVETMSQFLFVRELLAKTPCADPQRQIVVTTDRDPDRSLLRRIAQSENYRSFEIPRNVGGRFSVLSPVGLLSAAVAGIDIEQMLAGARRMDAACRTGDLHANPSALYAALLYLQYQRGKHISVLMPYSDALRGLADWYCQLWAESLGKRDGLTDKDIFVGPTPIASVGVTDQHSVMQLYQDGPFDKVVTLIELDDPHPEPLSICEGEPGPELSYLKGRSFNELFATELNATRLALTEKQRPNCTITVPAIRPDTLGELFMFFQYAVTYSGYLYGVNTFDQPGVELGKQYTYGLMGRAGYEPPHEPD